LEMGNGWQLIVLWMFSLYEFNRNYLLTA
jgi:hypothetical protein